VPKWAIPPVKHHKGYWTVEVAKAVQDQQQSGAGPALLGFAWYVAFLQGLAVGLLTAVFVPQKPPGTSLLQAILLLFVRVWGREPMHF
jgi:hypothetical protein